MNPAYFTQWLSQDPGKKLLRREAEMLHLFSNNITYRSHCNTKGWVDQIFKIQFEKVINTGSCKFTFLMSSSCIRGNESQDDDESWTSEYI